MFPALNIIETMGSTEINVKQRHQIRRNMFNIGEYVKHQTTGSIGKVIGYGHQILHEGDTTTLKVLVDYALASNKRGIVEEDLPSAWVKW